jgi:hypothetical protein
VPRQAADVALIDRMGTVEPVRQFLLPRFEALEERGQGLGVGHDGHGELMVQPFLLIVEGGGHVEDGPTVLNRHHPPGGEGAPIADPVHFVEDRHVGITGPQEVGV